VLHAFALLRAESPAPLRLLVLGCARWSPWVSRLVQQLDLGGSVILGSVEDHPLQAYAAADLLALPTRHDPFANVTLEALACGLPVVTTACNGATEQVGECPALFTVVQGEDAELLVALRTAVAVAADPSVCRSARAAVEGCSRERAIEAWEVVLAEGAKGEGGDRG
jgi:glycosyltransferase involved in cell wall biosynthesis